MPCNCDSELCAHDVDVCVAIGARDVDVCVAIAENIKDCICSQD